MSRKTCSLRAAVLSRCTKSLQVAQNVPRCPYGISIHAGRRQFTFSFLVPSVVINTKFYHLSMDELIVPAATPRDQSFLLWNVVVFLASSLPPPPTPSPAQRSKTSAPTAACTTFGSEDRGVETTFRYAVPSWCGVPFFAVPWGDIALGVSRAT